MLDIHGILQIDVSDCNNEVAQILQTAYADFVTSHPLSNPDIVVRRLRETGDIRRIVSQRKNLFPEEYIHKEIFQVIHFHRGSIESRIMLGRPIELQFRQDRNVKTSRFLARINDCVQMALETKEGSLIKAAALARGEHRIVMTGASGAGKTSLLLNMLDAGWDYVSDNTCLLHKGICHLFKRKMVFHTHHLEMLPERFRGTAGFVPARRWRPVRSILKKALVHTLPESVLRFEKVRRFYDPYLSADPLEVFPDVEILPGLSPTSWILLDRGDQWAMRPIARDEFVHKMVAITSLARPGWDAIRNWRTLLEEGYRHRLGSILEHNISAPCYKVTIPRDMDLKTVTASLETGLDRYAGRNNR